MPRIEELKYSIFSLICSNEWNDLEALSETTKSLVNTFFGGEAGVDFGKAAFIKGQEWLFRIKDIYWFSTAVTELRYEGEYHDCKMEASEKIVRLDELTTDKVQRAQKFWAEYLSQFPNIKNISPDVNIEATNLSEPLETSLIICTVPLRAKELEVLSLNQFVLTFIDNQTDLEVQALMGNADWPFGTGILGICRKPTLPDPANGAGILLSSCPIRYIEEPGPYPDDIVWARLFKPEYAKAKFKVTNIEILGVELTECISNLFNEAGFPNMEFTEGGCRAWLNDDLLGDN